MLIWRYHNFLGLNTEATLACRSRKVLRMVQHLRRGHEICACVPHSHGICLLRRRYDMEVTDVRRWDLLELHELTALKVGQGLALLV